MQCGTLVELILHFYIIFLHIQVSARLNNSTDPVEGNSKKAARYWEEVAAAYNETTPSDCKRDVKLLKSHWYKTTKKISSFNGCYNQMRDTYVSGRSDDQLMDQALELYRSRYKHHFTYVHWWRVVRDSPKWNAHIAAEGQGTKRSSPDLDGNNAPPNVRPIGCKQAKKMKANGNGTASTVVEQQLEKLVNAQTEINAGMSDMKEFQERLSSQKVEAAKLSYMAAKENKETKMLENKTKMMEHRSNMVDKFSEMLNVDTSTMEPWAKQAHLRAVTALSDELFGRDTPYTGKNHILQMMSTIFVFICKFIFDLNDLRS